MTNRTLVALVLAATLLLAGCSGGTATQTNEQDAATTVHPTTTVETPATDATTTGTTTADYPTVETENCTHRGPDDDDIVDESGACLPFDADTVYRRVLEMTGENITRGPTLTAVPARETRVRTVRQENGTFATTMGIESTGPSDAYSLGYAIPNRNPDGTVSPAVTLQFIGVWNDTALQERYDVGLTPEMSEAVAAHEFLHVVQFYRGSQEQFARNLSATNGTNANAVSLAIMEGSATEFAGEYWERYVDATPDDSEPNYSSWNAYQTNVFGPYAFGQAYTEWYLNDSVDDFEKLYSNPPVSMEQVIHKYHPDEERPLSLSVTGDVSSDWSHPSGPQTKGELFLRAALRSGVSADRAAAGAGGWGQDGVLTYTNISYSSSGNYETGYAWALRFDDASEAAEFERIFADWLDAKGEYGNGLHGDDRSETYRLVAVSNETVVVLAGHEDFTSQAVVSGNTTQVVVEHTSEDQTERVGNEDESIVVDAATVRRRA